jgi:drug/metabolite transporter (DMT)-like permease
VARAPRDALAEARPRAFVYLARVRSPPNSASTAALTFAALTGFAANSILCREALSARSIDAASFTLVRLLAGAITLGLLARALPRSAGVASARRAADWASAAALFGYAIAFSLAYLRLPAGAGALILFGAVQATMIGWGLMSGERPGAAEWAGLLIAIGGLAALALPGLSAPDPVGVEEMLLAGIAWGVYSLRGRGSVDPLGATAMNFTRAVPMAGAASLVALAATHATGRGVILAALSGSITSGVCYSIWFAALRGLTATRAAIVQLAVPILAAAGGIAILGETLTPRLLASGSAVLGGVALALARRRAG